MLISEASISPSVSIKSRKSKISTSINFLFYNLAARSSKSPRLWTCSFLRFGRKLATAPLAEKQARPRRRPGGRFHPCFQFASRSNGGVVAVANWRFHRPPQGTRKTTKKILHERTPWRVAGLRLSPPSSSPLRASVENEMMGTVQLPR